jgi:site-specific recombinase XerD
MKPSPVVTDLAQLLQRYFCSYLINQRRLSHHTMTSYRDMFKLLLPYIAKQLNKSVCALSLSDINADVIILFLAYLEEIRGNKVKTRNARLAAIHSFLSYAVVEEPQALPDIQRVMAIPEKRTDHFLFVCLEKDEIEALLNVHDLTTWTGQRDYILLLTLYNTGARVSEITRIQLKDVDIQRQKIIHLHGKGRKERIIPLWDNTCLEIKKWLNHYKSSPESPLIPNRYGNQITRFGVRQRLNCAVKKASIRCPSLQGKHITPHTIRHTTALHLLQSGVDLTVIALWLGHEKIETTHQYMEANLEMKKKALALLPAIDDQDNNSSKTISKDIMAFLESL